MSGYTFGYTPPPLETIFQRLFSLVESKYGPKGTTPLFRTCSRRMRSQDQLDHDEKPAFYQLQENQTPSTNESGMPYKDRIIAGWYVFVAQPDLQDLISPLLNPLCDAIRASLEPVPADERQTLDGIVQNVRFVGGPSFYEGLLGVNAYAYIRVEIFTGGLQPG